MAKITAPVKDFNGDIAGVQFTNGTAETDNAAVISYCAGAGYTVELDEPSQELPDGALDAALQAALASGETPSSVADGDLPAPDPEEPAGEAQPPTDNDHVAAGAELFPEPEEAPAAKPRRTTK